MNLQVRYHHVTRSRSLEKYLEDAFRPLASVPVQATVVFDREGHEPTVRCHLHGHRLNVVVRERGPDYYGAVGRIGRRLGRIARRLRRR